MPSVRPKRRENDRISKHHQTTALPILVRGTVTKCHPREYPGRDYIDDMEVLWMNGGPCNLDLTPEDDRRLSDELFEAASSAARGDY